MVKRGLDFWDVIMLIGAVAILFWATLKSLGIIHSPVWVNMIPYFGAGITLIAAVYKFGKMARGIEDTEKNVHKIDSELSNIKCRFNKVENEHNLLMDGKLRLKG